MVSLHPPHPHKKHQQTGQRLQAGGGWVSQVTHWLPEISVCALQRPHHQQCPAGVLLISSGVRPMKLVSEGPPAVGMPGLMGHV